MPKSKPPAAKPSSPPQPSPAAGEQSHRFTPSQAAVRETIESLVIAFVLAFLFRTFEAEMFVIPTGSMAPTLMGRHKDVICPKCGYEFAANASSEVDQVSGEPIGKEVGTATCPMCRYTIRLAFDLPAGEDRSFNGDRIVVDKLAYQLGQPQRWDVAVFKFPGAAKTNYIKRLVGLPGETIRLQYGDVYIRRGEAKEFSIARKSPDKLLAVLQPVYDNDYRCSALDDAGWPLRWQAEAAGAPGNWQPAGDHRSFSVDGTAAGPVWLRYRHFVPSYFQWRQIREQGRYEGKPRPLLITDFAAYNTSTDQNEQVPPATALGMHWVGDLVLECQLQARGNQGQVLLELRKGGYKFTCSLDLADGQARLAIDGRDDFHPAAKTPLRGPGVYRLRFSNVDEQLRLWVNERAIEFDAPTAYASLNNYRPTPADLMPVAIASDHAALDVRQLQIRRDLYYLSSLREPLLTSADREEGTNEVIDTLSTPSLWGRLNLLEPSELYPLAQGQFLMLGDNSAASSDSRDWKNRGAEYYVRRDLLIGRALYVFWPHSWDRIDLFGWHVWCPFFPNFARMKFVR